MQISPYDRNITRETPEPADIFVKSSLSCWLSVDSFGDLSRPLRAALMSLPAATDCGRIEKPRLMQRFIEYGFPYPDDLIMTFIGGSQLHGAKLQGRDDTDWYGVFIEPSVRAIGLDPYEHYVFTTGGKQGGNEPHDVDVCLYSLRKCALLAAKGNPSVLHFLFAKPELKSPIWEAFASNPVPFLAKSHINAFLGFANDQLRQLLNKKSRDVNRPALIEEHGYDTKFAMHLIRLYGEGRELMEHGRITLPRPDADFLVAIRHGKYRLHEIEQLAREMEQVALEASRISSLPDHVDRPEISRRLVRAYLEHWESRRSRS